VEKGTTKWPPLSMACHIPGSPGDVVFTHQHVELLERGVDLPSTVAAVAKRVSDP